MPARIYTEAPAIDGYGPEAVWPVLVGVTALVFGMAVGLKLPRIPRLRLSGSAAVPWVMRALLASHMAFYAVPGLSQLPSVGQLAQPVGLLGFGLAVLAGIQKAIGRYEIALVFGLLLPVRIALGLVTGSLNNALILVAVLVILAAVLNRRLLVPVLGVVVLGMFAYAPMKAYRNYAWNIPPGTPATEKAAIILSMLSENSFADAVKVPAGRWSYLDGILWPLLKRLDQATVLAVVVERTGHDVEPWAGKTLARLVTGIVPRFLWPEKPAETLGNEFGRRYGLLRQDEYQMSVNLPWLTEFYANFLMPGVGIGMLSVGMLLGILDRLLNRPDPEGVEVVFAAAILLPLAVPESNISLMISNLPIVGAVLWLGLRLALRPPG